MTADPHATAVPRTEVSASLSELRTFLIADIRGYTRFTQQHGDEVAARLAARFAALMREGVVARGGHVLELRGDEALAVFGSARAALRAALAVQASLAEATAANPVLPLAVGMGLDAGEAVPVEGGYRGGALNLAARLCSLAGPGEVFASEGVVHLAGTVAGLAYVERGQVPLKGLAAPVRVVQVVPEGAEPAELRPLPGAAGRLRPLPVPPTPFIGRVSEVAAVSALLRGGQQRLVTLTGAGGTGKTRLALEVARQVQDACADGVAFVSLAPLSDPALVVSAIAQALGVREAAGQPLVETLTESLRSKQLLLVLDNFEHLLAAATLVAELLAACPGLTVLATSRAPLRVQGEQEYLVPPLVVPDPQHLPPLAVLTQYEAVRLFSMRAQQVKADFAVSPQNAAAVAQICARLDGLPLAIELAAARVRLLPPPALLARLGSRLGLLVGGPWDLPARQQTLRATLDWSYSLLSEDEQRLFARLAVFVGGRTLEAIEAVCNSAGDLDVLEGVQSLVEKNLMRQEEGVGGEPRVVLLETIHEYAWERLAASGEAEELRRRHAAFFVTLAEVTEPELTGPHQGEWLQRLEAEHANLRAALTWSS